MPLEGVEVGGVDVVAETFGAVGAAKEAPVAEEVPAGGVVYAEGSPTCDLLCGLGLTSSTAGRLSLLEVRSKLITGRGTSVQAL